MANKLVEARGQVETKSKHFEKLTASMGDDRTDIWEGLDTSPVVIDGKTVSVYRHKEVKGKWVFVLVHLLVLTRRTQVPTMDAIEARLCNTKDSNVKIASAHVMPAQFIADGIKLETRQ